MSSQNRYTLEITPLAQLDIADILQYTHETYGAKQRKNYSDTIRKTIENIKFMPKSGHSRKDIEPSYKAWNINSHTIIYGIEGNQISVFRVLHQSRDIPRLL